MKKLPLALAISALTTVPLTFAETTLYESEQGKFSTYGALQFEVETYEGQAKFQSQASHLGFSGERQLKHGLTAFANLEIEYDASRKNKISSDADDDGELEIYNTYLGVSGGFGELKLGNFDSVIYDLVTGQADIMENLGYRGLVENETHAHGSSLAYTLPEFVDGLEIALAVKHYASAKALDAGTSSDTSKQQFNFQFAANYSLTNEFSLGFGVDQNNKNVDHIEHHPIAGDERAVLSKANGKTDPIFALSALYANETFHLGLTAEKSGDFKLANLTGGFNYGAGEVYALVSFADDSDEKGVDWGLGANYELGEDFLVYAEVARGNDKNSELQGSNGKATQAITFGAAYYW